jgi:hypothetical protein
MGHFMMEWLTRQFTSTVLEKLEKRAKGIEEWTRENEGTQKRENRSTLPDSPERLYWNYGYLSALRDVIGLLTRKNAKLN